MKIKEIKIWQKLLENIKDEIISKVFNNQEISLAEKIKFCQELENFGEGWRNLILEGKLETQKEVKKNDSSLKKLQAGIK